MAVSERITNVNVESAVKFGQFANAFRVVEEVGPDCFLDFMVYSAAEEAATVVARLRVRRDFLDAIRRSLGDAIIEFDGGDGRAQAAGNIVFRKNGQTVH